MKKIIYCFLLWMPFSGILYAFDTDKLPKKMYLTQRWVSYSNSFEIGTKTKKLGALYSGTWRLPLTYDFYDQSDKLVTSVKARFLSIGAHFDIYDNKKNLLGSIEDKMFTFSQGFIIYSPHSVKLATAGMNFWGTTFSIYDALGEQPIAVMSRPLFRVTNDWTVDILNKELLKSSSINPDLFLTILALQRAREYWTKQHNKSLENSSDLILQIQDKIALSIQELDLNDVQIINTNSLETLAEMLERDYTNQRKIGEPPVDFTSDIMMNDFVDFCLHLVQSTQISLSDKKSILYLLQQRIGIVHAA